MTTLNETEYDFTDSIIIDIKRDVSNLDYILSIDCYVGKDSESILNLRLKNAKKIEINANILDKNDAYSPYTLCKITKRKKGEYMEFVCESAFSMLPEFVNDAPLLYCLCDEVYIEKTDEHIDKLLNA